MLGLHVENVEKNDELSDAASTPRVKAKNAIAHRKNSSTLSGYSGRGLREKHKAMP